MLQMCAVDYTAFFLLRPLAKALTDEYEVHFASSTGNYVSAIREEGFTYYEIPIARSYNLAAHIRSVFLLRRLMKRERYDIVHAHTPVAALLGRIAARLARVPIVVYTAHGFYFHERMRPLARRFFEALERAGGRLSDFVFTQSGEDRDAAIKLGIVDENQVLHIGNGVDLSRFDPDRLRGRRDAIRDSLGIPLGALVVCAVGRLVREKGYRELVAAFVEIAERFPEARLVVVGSTLQSAHDDASGEVMSSIRLYDLSDRVLLLEPQTPVEEILIASDIYTLPSYREGMPRTILEAMAMGLPVVATNIRGSREVVVDGATGTLVEVADPEALSLAIIDLLEDPARRLRYGERAKAIARREFDEIKVIEKQREVFRRLCEAEHPAAG